MPEIKSTDLQVNKTIDVPAPDSQLTITADPAKPLPLGVYTFQLTVTDNANNVSPPTTCKVQVYDNTAPTAVINAPPRVAFGQPILLSGQGSTDAGGGTIAKYTWTLIATP